MKIMISSTPETLARILSRSFLNKNRYEITLCLMRNQGCIENLKYHPCDVRQHNALLQCVSMTLFRNWENYSKGLRLIREFCRADQRDGEGSGLRESRDNLATLLDLGPPGRYASRCGSTEWEEVEEWRHANSAMQFGTSWAQALFSNPPCECEGQWWVRWVAAADCLLRTCNASSPDGVIRPLEGDMFEEVEPHRSLWECYRELSLGRLRTHMASSSRTEKTTRWEFLKYRMIDDLLCTHVDIYTVLSYLASGDAIFVGHFGSFHSANIVALLRAIGFSIDIELTGTLDVTQPGKRCLQLASRAD